MGSHHRFSEEGVCGFVCDSKNAVFIFGEGGEGQGGQQNLLELLPHIFFWIFIDFVVQQDFNFLFNLWNSKISRARILSLAARDFKHGSS